ncbi:TPA: CDP-2,3-bis-(O-geranylgeranyl)-sn-glycerol synthase [Candidatus Micrarchaeota archaeon]|nr:CDP-2,3-bis-(O-geranylgeranyl)-sn-glycerol synthase [Candidatus Micrarchaeota archaeon]HIH30699.1 CDP-2,3-bis-(O-geranylgeranyl)-sn-glycerol synthase [Candidatus Micrarchaeota archaeon]
MDALSIAIRSILFILPSYFANSIPVVLGGGAPLDGKRKFSDGQRIFGDGKTVRGFFSGIATGTLVGALEGIMLSGTAWDIYGSGASAYVAAGFLLGAGTMAGDLVGSFVKRRQKVARGKPSWIMDQLMFLLFAFLFSYPLAAHLLTLESVLFLTILTYFVHIGANVLANRWGLKKVPW